MNVTPTNRGGILYSDVSGSMGKLYTDIFCHLIFPSITNHIMRFKMYADET